MIRICGKCLRRLESYPAYLDLEDFSKRVRIKDAYEGCCDGAPVVKTTQKELEHFVKYLAENKIEPETLSGRSSILYRYLVKEGKIVNTEIPTTETALAVVR